MTALLAVKALDRGSLVTFAKYGAKSIVMKPTSPAWLQMGIVGFLVYRRDKLTYLLHIKHESFYQLLSLYNHYRKFIGP
ncbi:hypothetical protein HHL25_19015 [Rhizobium sp. S-51]|uniref:Uncharacterized protein n=1 Tax=Rhizobium terricola TaxID=2728849 RepID=A0A7Y0FX65_9HYPH|nr:hypothetical protein [Rhizobium terricola]NML76228.1 hypothetical protein [Rhizobium terricola]